LKPKTKITMVSKSPKMPGSSKKVRKIVEEDEGHDSDVDMKDSSSNANSGSGSSSKKQRQEMSARELRVQRREQESARKIQQTGLGISKENAPKGKKIIFGDVEESLVQQETTPVDDEKDGEPDMDEEQVQEEGGDDDDDDDDDDAVEEMNTAVARENVREQRGKERATARAATVLVKPRRNKRKKQVEVETADNEFDDDFFAQLDEEMTEEQKQQKERKLVQPKGRHTTFVVPDEDAAGTSVPVEHNIEVAVLGEPFDHVILNTEQTETALSFSRSRLDNGSDGVSAKQLQKQKQQGKKTAETPSWQRSKKMNRMLLSGARSQRRKGQGKAAAHFVVAA
jgi:hypothetical protein